MSFSWLFLGGVVSTRARLRFTNRAPVCGKLASLVEDFSANGKVSLNWLSHPRGQVQSPLFSFSIRFINVSIV